MIRNEPHSSPGVASIATGIATAKLVCLVWAGAVVCAVAVVWARPLQAQERPQRVSFTSVGFSENRLRRLGELAEEAIAAGEMPGCVICFGRAGKIAYLESFGQRAVEPVPEAMTIDTVFDLASLTKPVATATSVMQLVERGQVTLGTRVAEVLPEFGKNGKEVITVQQLLVHQSGLIPDNHLRDYQEGPEVAWERICELGLVAPVGEVFKYSDVNFIVLAELVRRVTGQDVHSYSQAEIFEPLGMHETGFKPESALRRRAAPTEQRDGAWMRGDVHDPRAFLLGGVAGHAGLFSTAEDLAVYASMMLGRGRLGNADGDGPRTLSEATWERMTRRHRVSSGYRGLGWDKQTGYSSNRGDLLSDAAFGHGGFTGTVLWMDPEQDLFFVLLSNRLHPDGKGSVNRLAGRMLNVIVGAQNVPRGADYAEDLSAHDVDEEAWDQAGTLTGIDVLRRDGFERLRGQRVGLISNHTGRARDGSSTVTLLHETDAVNLVALFSPEHGFTGTQDVARIDDSEDQTTGLRIFSLYGKTRRPTAEMLAEVDTLVFDIQDIGCRFYTYISTMGEAMIAAAEHGKRFVVLDRPNPINGTDVMGPMLDAGSESFVGFHRLPVRHGMTIGEIARLLRGELELDLELDVVTCEGWTRDEYWEETNLTWVNPSPNMRSLTEAFLYPGIGLLEMTNVSVGRGTDTPFEVLGAPWIDGRRLAKYLNGRGLAGVVFVPVEFTPNASKFAEEKCGGIQMMVTSRAEAVPVRVGLEVACALRRLYPEDWDVTRFNRLLGNQAVYDAVVGGRSMAEVWELAHEGLGRFKRTRGAYLLYPETR